VKNAIIMGYSVDGYAVKEAGRQPPPFPFIFFKPNTTVTDHDAPVTIPKIAQDDQADYEGELVSTS
jgi:2-keto-4-pentenoate hydratase/2-oxohepta-3-ene-1,7-dioic acid hydratase in catechol pathway